jgi:hypothetical protein
VPAPPERKTAVSPAADMRIRVSDPQLVPSLLSFLTGHVHVNAEQVGPMEVEISQLGSMNARGRRLELDLMLQVWCASNTNASASIVREPS